MRRGSITVRPGDTIARGQRLGLVGLSGQTEFPHVHLTVRHDGATIDPFLGDTSFGACRASTDALWDPKVLAALAYRPSVIYNSGFAGAPPDPDRIRRGDRGPAPATDAPALVLWVDIFGVDAGDRVALRLLGPDGQTITENVRVIEKHQARRFEYAGRKARGAWPAGSYRGEITVAREDGAVLDRREERIELR
jgi:murein DD-endopeptidase MepM/ murein hydrolase activator NlpD